MVDHSPRARYRNVRLHDRRPQALLLLGLMVVSMVTNFEASLCTPGMAMGGDASMAMEMDDASPEGMHCWAAVATSDGAPLCPFSVGGVGPCGTTSPVPVQEEVRVALGLEVVVQSPSPRTQLLQGTVRVPTPPPRA